MAVREEREKIKSWHLARGEDNIIVPFVILILFVQKNLLKEGQRNQKNLQANFTLCSQYSKNLVFFLQPWSRLKTKSWLSSR